MLQEIAAGASRVDMGHAPTASRVRQLMEEGQLVVRDEEALLRLSGGATEDERVTYERRVGIERVVFCLFPRVDSAKVAPQYALDADVEPDWQGMPEMPRREAKFIDQLLTDLPKPWLAPYLNLVAGHRKLCASEMDGAKSDARGRSTIDDGRRQLTRARDGGHGLIRVVAEHLLTTGRCGEQQ